MSAVDGEVDGVRAEGFEFESAEIEDEVGADGRGSGAEFYFEVAIDGGHDGFPIGVDEVDFYAVVSFFDPVEADAEGDSAMGVEGGELPGVDGIEGTEDIKFAALLGGGVAEGEDFELHGGMGLTGLVGSWGGIIVGSSSLGWSL